jgi:L-amino acid N-acyltransferase YncA
MHIRPIEPGDAAGTVRLLNAIIASGLETAMAEPLTLSEQQDYIASFPPRGIFLVAQATAGGPIVGMQSLEPRGALADCSGHIGEISTFVDARFRGQGVGSALMLALCAEAKARGFRKLMATIRADNPRAQAFYVRSGFRIVGLLKGNTRYRGTYLDQVLAERLLIDSAT